ncbi:hypothetical protein E2C01_091631 [Portunus trituberculatus]|uniref:Uncharacterized protein n=1 Tax=Portunus trituberculatus TaxID=210409 RepID=A0A5B7JPL0_PORTR|nr:hypothetical protein [Portunus trituberculatus]
MIHKADHFLRPVIQDGVPRNPPLPLFTGGDPTCEFLKGDVERVASVMSAQVAQAVTTPVLASRFLNSLTP